MFSAFFSAQRGNPMRSPRPSPATAAAQRSRQTHISVESHGAPGGRYVGDVVLGGLDGILTSFAIVSGAAGAKLAPEIVPILGLATLVADGIAMGASAFLSAKSQREFYEEQQRREYAEVEAIPEVESREMYDIYRGRGYSDKHAQDLVDILSQNKDRWVKAMLVEELGLLEDERKPAISAMAVFGSFVVSGMAPLLVYLAGLFVGVSMGVAFIISIVSSAVALFILGAAKVLLTKRNPMRAGLEMLFVGSLAGGAAYAIGAALHALVGIATA